MSSISAFSNAIAKRTIPFSFSYNKTRTTRGQSLLQFHKCSAVPIRKLTPSCPVLLLKRSPSDGNEDPQPGEPKPGIESPKQPTSPPLGPEIPFPIPDVPPGRTPPSPPDVVPPSPPEVPPKPPGPEIIPPPGSPRPDIHPPPHGPIWVT